MSIPKVELHCHLDGSLPVQIVSELLGREVKQSEMQVSEDCRNLAEYLEKFDLPLQCLQTEEGLRKASKSFLMDLQKDNVQYVEVRFAPLLSVNEHLNCRQVIQSVIEGLEEAKKECNIFYNVIACAMRHHSNEENLEMMKAAREFWGEGLCAVDLAGNEVCISNGKFCGTICRSKETRTSVYHSRRRVRKSGKCHCVRQLRCGRIGHGIALRGHKEGIALCKEKKIGIEMCPISNLQTKAVQHPSEYPIREFLDAGLLVTINTDNRTVSNSSLEKEMRFIQEQYGITDEELIKMTGNAIDVAFAEDSVKAELWRRLRGV